MTLLIGETSRHGSEDIGRWRGPSETTFVVLLDAAGLDFVGGLVAERGVQAGGVEPADVLDDSELELPARAPHAIGDQLGLEASTKLSASALSYASPTVPIDARTQLSESVCA